MERDHRIDHVIVVGHRLVRQSRVLDRHDLLRREQEQELEARVFGRWGRRRWWWRWWRRLWWTLCKDDPLDTLPLGDFGPRGGGRSDGRGVRQNGTIRVIRYRIGVDRLSVIGVILGHD